MKPVFFLFDKLKTELRHAKALKIEISHRILITEQYVSRAKVDFFFFKFKYNIKYQEQENGK